MLDFLANHVGLLEVIDVDLWNGSLLLDLAKLLALFRDSSRQESEVIFFHSHTLKF